MKVWLNGQLLETSHAAVPVTDHGLTVGDGVFETAALHGGVPFALTRHLERLVPLRRAAGAGAAARRDDLRLAVGELLAAEAGGAGGGTGPAADHAHRRTRLRTAPSAARTGPTVLITVAPRARPGPRQCDVAIVPWTRNENAPTAGAKTTSYADNVVALAEAHRRGAAEAIFANTRGELCEGTGSNVFVGLGGRLYTPPLSSGCLAGITRELLLEWTDAGRGDALDRCPCRRGRGVPGVVDPRRPGDPHGRRRPAAGRARSPDAGSGAGVRQAFGRPPRPLTR